MAETFKIVDDTEEWARKGGRKPTEIPPAIVGAVAGAIKDGRNKRVTLPNDQAEEFVRLLKIQVRRVGTHALYTDTVPGEKDGTSDVRFMLKAKKSK